MRNNYREPFYEIQRQSLLVIVGKQVLSHRLWVEILSFILSKDCTFEELILKGGGY